MKKAVTIDMNNISVPDSPIEIDMGKWVINHPDCDAIFDIIEGGPVIIVYAFSTAKEGNRPLHAFRDMKFSGKRILKGVSKDGVAKLI